MFWSSPSICNAEIRLGLASPALNNVYFSKCLIDVWILPIPTWILLFSLSYLFAANCRPYLSTFEHPRSIKAAKRWGIFLNLLCVAYSITCAMVIYKLASSQSGIGFLVFNNFGVLAVFLLMLKRSRDHFRGRELGIMLTLYWFSLFTLYFLKARMLVSLDSINSSTGYLGPPSYSNAYNEMDNYILAIQCFILGFVENLTMLKRVKEDDMIDLPLAQQGSEMGSTTTEGVEMTKV